VELGKALAKDLSSILDVVGLRGNDDDDEDIDPMSRSVLLVRLLVPQLLMAGWLFLVWFVCKGQAHAEFFAASEYTLTVGPGCISPPDTGGLPDTCPTAAAPCTRPAGQPG
jgi:hypothetical protein